MQHTPYPRRRSGRLPFEVDACRALGANRQTRRHGWWRRVGRCWTDRRHAVECGGGEYAVVVASDGEANVDVSG